MMKSEDTREARGRLQQDTTFSLDELVGRPLRRLSAARLEGGDPLCLYVEVDAPGCHRLFLDAGLAVWEDWGGITEDDRELELDDLLTAWCLDGAWVRSAAALAGPKDGAVCFEIDLGERGTVVLETIDGERSRCSDVDALRAETEPPPVDQRQRVDEVRTLLAEATVLQEAGRYEAARSVLERASD